jgi:predicted NACHT family NTPase
MFERLIKNATGGLDNVVNELIIAAHDKVKEKIKEVFSIHKLEKLKTNIARVGKVKTILNPDSIIELNDIFIESAISLNDEGIFQSVENFSSNHVLIEGGPGKGKSLYLRHLCLREGESPHYIPIFIEFRYLRYEKSLREELFDEINNFGVELDDSIFDYLAKSKKLLFILDGFDEIPNIARQKTSRDLETIARTYPDLKIIVSSRPDSGMGSSVYFKKYKISNLNFVQQCAFINHLYNNQQQAKEIIDILIESKFLEEVTNTPLLLTLFTITYNARQFRPDSLSEFYSLIFPTMLYRHDRMKIGYERERKSKLTDYQMQRLFESFSFISLKDNKTRFNSSRFHEFLDLASKNERLEENLEDKLIEDLTQITALIVPDGFDDYSFSHKSIQEYFAAVFISKIDEGKRSKFYRGLSNNFDEFRKWQNVLSFLETIDDRVYKKSFLLPLKKKALGLDNNKKIKITYTSLLELIGTDSKLSIDEDGNLHRAYWGDTFTTAIYKEYSSYVRRILYKYLKAKKAELAEFLFYCDQNAYELYNQDDRIYILKVSLLLDQVNLRKDICIHVSAELEKSSFIQEINSIEGDLIASEQIENKILDF